MNIIIFITNTMRERIREEAGHQHVHLECINIRNIPLVVFKQLRRITKFIKTYHLVTKVHNRKDVIVSPC